MTALDDLRRYIDEPISASYPDAVLLDRLTSAQSTYHLARDIWYEKAGRYARLVDMQEGSSRRSLSQLQENALRMATWYGKLANGDGDGGTTGRRPTRIRPIERV